jgi:hypothetical protein
VCKEKALYYSLNNFKSGSTTFIGYFWSPVAREFEISDHIRAHPTVDFKRFNNHTITPPTYIKGNEFTNIF